MSPAEIRFRIPLRAPFRGVTLRDGILIEGPAGWGESSPFPWFTAQAKACHASAQEAANEPFPQALRDRIPVHTTIPAVSPDQAAELARASGCTTAKVKVADGDDDARLAAVRDALGPNGRIRIDANGAWDAEMAVREIRRLSRHGLELVEQPVATIEEMAEVRTRVDVPLAADESVRTREDAVRAVRAGAVDILVLKVQPLGGVRAALAVAEAAGIPCIVSSPLETSIGLAASVALAAALPELAFACGLATLPLLAGDVTAEPLLPRGGWIDVRRPDVDAGVAAQWTVSPTGRPN